MRHDSIGGGSAADIPGSGFLFIGRTQRGNHHQLVTSYATFSRIVVNAPPALRLQ